jgi:hypothetical protein
MTKRLRIPDEPRFARAFAPTVDPGDTLGLLMEIGALGSPDPSAALRTSVGIVRRTRKALSIAAPTAPPVAPRGVFVQCRPGGCPGRERDCQDEWTSPRRARCTHHRTKALRDVLWDALPSVSPLRVASLWLDSSALMAYTHGRAGKSLRGLYTAGQVDTIVPVRHSGWVGGL